MLLNTQPNSRLALVTGAAKRLGSVTARALHALGFDVLLHYHTSRAEAEALAQELDFDRSGSVALVCADLADPAAPDSIIESATRFRARLDLLVNNASVFEPTALDGLDLAAWERLHAINLRAPTALALRGAPLLRRTGGSIVNIVDIHAERPRARYVAYCASKAGLIAVTRVLALELGPEVRVNAVAPGAILWAESEDAALRAATIDATPLARRGEPRDIAEAVCYLAQARFVSGQVITVDGGRALVS